MNRKFAVIIFFLLFATALGGQEKTNAFKDPSFSAGLSVLCPDRAADTVCTVLKVDSLKTPVWTLSQYNSKFNLVNSIKDEGINRYTYSLPGNGNLNAKVVSINPVRGALTLECNASAEYSGLRSKDQPWIYMTAEAPLDTLVLAKYRQVPLYLSCRVLFYEDCMGFLADKAIHAATYRVNFKVRNINQSGKLYGKFFTLSLILFDNRYIGVPIDASLRDSRDGEEGEFVYTPSSQQYISSSLSNYRLLKPRQSAEVSTDLLAMVKSALTAALEEGRFDESYLAEWEITGCNLGWEMTGTYNASLEVRGLKLSALP